MWRLLHRARPSKAFESTTSERTEVLSVISKPTHISFSSYLTTLLPSVSVIVNIFALAFYYHASESLPTGYHAGHHRRLPARYHLMVTLIVISIMNTMACKVYRHIKLGRISGT